MATGARGSYAKTAARKREIVEASFDVFAEKGFTNGSLRDIADRVGITAPAVLHHFGNKTELLASVLRLRDEKSVAVFEGVREPGVDDVRALIALVELNSQIPGLVELHCILSAEATSPDHPAHAYFEERYTGLVTSATRSYAAMRQRGELLATVEPGALARSTVAIIDGLQIQWLLDRSVDMVGSLRDTLQPLITVRL